MTSCNCCSKKFQKLSNNHFKLCSSCNHKRLTLKKQNDKLNRLNAVKQEVESISCLGCGGKNKRLDKAHIIPISLEPALKYDKDNIKPLCRDCHLLWEHSPHDKASILICYQDFLKYMESAAHNRYYSLMYKITHKRA
jgi:5-methylcytosine-specific restriction endonuclease McrA